ncbi:helix-turn-helix domain-containing protein [Enterococcus faecalis]
MKPVKEKVGKRIHEIRTNLGYSLSEFGKLIGDSPKSSVNNWEKGISLPKEDKLEKIAILGNTTPDQILYGELYEYVFDLVKQNLNLELNDQFIFMILMAAAPHKLSYHDDVRWLQGVKKILETSTIEKQTQALIYVPVGSMENLYIGQINIKDIEQSEFNNGFDPLYYIYADVKDNILHVIPFPLNKNSKQLLFNPPNFIETRGEHVYFTNNFEKINLDISNSCIIYYGIDETTLSENIIKFKYQEKEDNFHIDNSLHIDLVPSFKSELQKAILELKNTNH